MAGAADPVWSAGVDDGLARAEWIPSLRRSVRRSWQAEAHWRAPDGSLANATIVLEAPPPPFGLFAHPEVAEGRLMQVTALIIDDRRRWLRLDLAQRRATGGSDRLRQT